MFEDLAELAWFGLIKTVVAALQSLAKHTSNDSFALGRQKGILFILSVLSTKLIGHVFNYATNECDK